jgi:cell division initiation protein
MFLTPPEIQHQQLNSRRGNYDRQQVDELLEHVAASYEQVWHERDAARAQLSELERRISDYEELERRISEYEELDRLLRDSLVTGQRAAEVVKAEAAEEAEALLEEARGKAEEIVSRAHRERTRMEAEIERLRLVEEDVQARCRAILVGALEALSRQDASTPAEPRSLARETAVAER